MIVVYLSLLVAISVYIIYECAFGLPKDEKHIIHNNDEISNDRMQ